MAYLAAVMVSRRILPLLNRTLAPDEARRDMIATAMRFALRFLPLLMPVLAYGFTALGEEVTRSVFGSGDVIAFVKVFLFLAARILVAEF